MQDGQMRPTESAVWYTSGIETQRQQLAAHWTSKNNNHNLTHRPIRVDGACSAFLEFLISREFKFK